MSLFQTQRWYVPVTVYGTTHAHLVQMCWPLLWGIHQIGRSSATFGTYAVVGSLQWIMRVLNSQGLRLWWMHHPSPQSRRSPPWLRNPKRNSSKCAILVPRNSLPFLWTPDNTSVT